jgi:predicted nucleic acid-binding protein
VPGTPTIDTNVRARYFDRDAPEHESVVGPVEEALRSERVTIDTIIVMEVSHFLIKNLGPVEGGEKVRIFLRFPLAVSDFDYRDPLEAIEMLKRYSRLGVGGRDATLLALMDRAKIKRMMTHDEALKRVDWLDVVDPGYFGHACPSCRRSSRPFRPLHIGDSAPRRDR